MIGVFGAGGQVGRALCAHAQAGCVHHRPLRRPDGDILDPASIARALDGVTVAVNCAGYNAVDQAETERDDAFAANAEGPRLLAEGCAAQNIPVIQLSSDYVFDGALDRPYRPDDSVAPLSVYGESKATGEQAVRRANQRHLIVRVARVFSVFGPNFATRMRELATDGETPRVVNDQIGGPTPADAIASLILRMAETCVRPHFDAWGTYHFCGRPAASWFDVAERVYVLSGEPVGVTPVATEDRPVPARRPKQAMLDCATTQAVFGIPQPDWRDALGAVMAALDAEAGPCAA